MKSFWDFIFQILCKHHWVYFGKTGNAAYYGCAWCGKIKVGTAWDLEQ